MAADIERAAAQSDSGVAASLHHLGLLLLNPVDRIVLFLLQPFI